MDPALETGFTIIPHVDISKKAIEAFQVCLVRTTAFVKFKWCAVYEHWTHFCRKIASPFVLLERTFSSGLSQLELGFSIVCCRQQAFHEALSLVSGLGI